MNVFYRLFVAATLLLASAQALAVSPGNRQDLFYDIGYFHLQNGWWYETINGTYQFEFREVRRNDQSIDIYDQSRKLTVRLYNDSFWLKFDNEPAFHKFKDAHWDNRRLAFFGDNVHFQYFLLGTGNQWRHVVNPAIGSPSTTFYREVSRAGGIVELRSDQMKVTMRIMGQSPNLTVIRYLDGQPSATATILANGTWGAE